MTSFYQDHGLQQMEQSKSSNQALEMKQLRERISSAQNEEQELREACQEFEAVFIQKMWEQMRETVPQEGYLHSQEKDMYMSMFDEKLSQEMAGSGGGIGLADMLFEHLKGHVQESNVEASSNTPTQLGPVGGGQNLPPETDAENENPASGKEHDLKVREILDMNISPRERAEMLAGQIEVNFGNRVPEPPELKPESDEPRDPERRDTQMDLEAVQEPDSLKESEPEPQQESNDLPPLEMPVQGEVSSEFGWREDPFTGEQAWHPGIDFAVEEGTPVKAAWPGEVTFAGEDGGYGQKVVVEHPQGWESVYAHNSDNLVQEGDVVQQGQEIALSGNSGRSTGPHLHFEVRQGDMAWNPNLIKDRMLAGLDIGEPET